MASYRTTGPLLFLLPVLATIPGSAIAQPPSPLRQIQEMVQNGDFEAAERRVAEDLKAGNATPDLYNLRGIIMAQKGQVVQAEEAFQHAIRLNPRYSPAYLNLGRLYVQRVGGDTAAATKAEHTYLRLLAFEPGNREANYEIAQFYLYRSDYRRVLSHLARLPLGDRERYAVTVALCAAAAGIGDRAAALNLAEKLATSPELAETQALTISSAAMKAAPDVAVRILEALDGRRLATTAGLRQLGVAYEAKSRYSEARQAYERAASGNVTASLLVDLGRAANASGEHEAALGYLAHARDMEPGEASIHYAFGRICADLDLTVEALQAFERATNLAPAKPEYIYALGLALLASNRADDAAAQLQRYRTLKPSDPWGWFSLARADFLRLEDERAQAEFRQAAAFPQTAPGAHLYLGKLAVRVNMLAEAVREFHKSLRIHPGTPEVLAELGATQIELGEYRQATANLEAALAGDPKSFDANRALLRLYQRIADPRLGRQVELVRKLTEERAERARSVQRRLRFEAR